VAYLSGGALRVVAGDGTGDHLLAARVAGVAPAWRPGHDYQLAYVSRGGLLILRGADSGGRVWARSAGSGVRKLQWSGDGHVLLAAARGGVALYGAGGSRVWAAEAPSGAPLLDAAISPDGRNVALVFGGSRPEVLVEATSGHRVPRRVLSGVGLRQVLWSPDARWLLVSWPAANQWVFIRVAGRVRIAAVSHIAQQFSRGGASRAFPQLEGWCCTAGR
jgi:tricorn protease-like protein